MKVTDENYGLVKKALSRIDGFLGLGVGLKERADEVTDLPAWRIYVKHKKNKHVLPVSQLIPAIIAGKETDVIEKRTSHPAGASIDNINGKMIANYKGIPGTAGCIATTINGNCRVLLTNYHVLFGEGNKRDQKIWLVEKNNEHAAFKEIGKSVGGKIGTVSCEGSEFYVDCAIGILHAQPAVFTSVFNNECPFAEEADIAVVGSKVTKRGSATQSTEGIVVDTQYPDISYFDGVPFQAPNQILIRPLDPRKRFCEQGDSGAVIRNQNNKISGLLWGVNCNGEGVACHINPVLASLGIVFIRHQKLFGRDTLKKLCRKICNTLIN